MSPLQAILFLYLLKKKKIIAIISALQMAQTPSTLKSKVEIVLDVSCINLAPRMAIMLLVCSLHLVRLIVGIDKEEFKQNITIKMWLECNEQFQCETYHSSNLSIWS
jgi:hypothetical protein